MSNIQYHYNRRPRNFLRRSVRDVLPEHFTQDYPKLITFLEKYYDYMDSDEASSFDHQLRKIYQTRDIQETPSNLLTNLISEIAAGNTGDNFIDPSDPDVDLPNSIHAYQTAERIRKKYPLDKQLQITGLIHDLGKVLFDLKKEYL